MGRMLALLTEAEWKGLTHCKLVLAAHTRLKLWTLLAVVADKSCMDHFLTTESGD